MKLGRAPTHVVKEALQANEEKKREQFQHHIHHCVHCQDTVTRLILTDHSSFAGHVWSVVLGHAAANAANGHK